MREARIINIVITKAEVAEYLNEAKYLIERNKYRIERNTKRKENMKLFLDYLVDEKTAKEILLSITADDFSEATYNEHTGFEHELLFIFGKDVQLIERSGTKKVNVPLYIKFNKLDNDFVIVISLHEQKYPLKYCFK